MRRAAPGDRPVIEAALRARLVTSMFPLSNLARHGMDGAHNRSMSFWIADRAGGPPDIIAKTREGMVMPSCDGKPWTEAADALTGEDAIGVIGAASQARPLIDALCLAGVVSELDEDEPQFLLDLARLIVPDGVGELVPLDGVDRDLMIRWRRDYCVEALGTPDDKALSQAETDIDGYIAADTYRVLVGPDGPLAVTGFNAETDGIVQIGGVFTPKALRGQGHGRRVVALHLAQARARGIRKATLFASGAPAVRAYKTVGFEQIGTWTLFITAQKERIGG